MSIAVCIVMLKITTTGILTKAKKETTIAKMSILIRASFTNSNSPTELKDKHFCDFFFEFLTV